MDVGSEAGGRSRQPRSKSFENLSAKQQVVGRPNDYNGKVARSPAVGLASESWAAPFRKLSLLAATRVDSNAYNLSDPAESQQQ